MRLAVWNIQPCIELFGASAAGGAEIRFGDPEECKKLLLDGEVDVTMMGINEVLRSVDAFTIFPELVLASKSSKSFATLQLNVPLDEVTVVDALPEHRQAGEVAEILLREHYRRDVKVRYRSPIGTNGEAADAWVAFGTVGQDDESGRSSLDIGQEWFEMIAHPLIWGVFVMRGGLDPSDFGEQLLDLASVENLTSEGIRPRFDAEVLRGLDELAHYLFYFGKVDDIPMPRFTESPDSIPPPE